VDKLVIKKRMNIFYKGAIVVLAIIVTSCNKENYKYAEGDDCILTALTYEGRVKNIINGSCAYIGCHADNVETYDFTTYEGIKSASGSIKDRINRVTDDPLFMPQNKLELSECDLAILNTWINNGAPLK